MSITASQIIGIIALIVVVLLIVGAVAVYARKSKGVLSVGDTSPGTSEPEIAIV